MSIKKTKGFTLIELLAVIVILAVLSLIITPVITNIISSAKEGAFKSSAYGIADAAKNYCASSMLQNDGELTDSVRFTVNNGELVAANGDKLELKGKMPIGDSWVNITTNCGVSLSVTDGNYYATKDTDETTVTLSTVENGALTRDELTEEVNQLKDTINTLNSKIDNKLNMTLLWTNPNPNADFAAQTVALDLTDYDAVIITFNNLAAPSPSRNSELCFKNELSRLAQVWGISTYRDVTPSDTGIYFNHDMWYLSYSGSATPSEASGKTCVPQEIYGIKFN